MPREFSLYLRSEVLTDTYSSCVVPVPREMPPITEDTYVRVGDILLPPKIEHDATNEVDFDMEGGKKIKDYERPNLKDEQILLEESDALAPYLVSSTPLRSRAMVQNTELIRWGPYTVTLHQDDDPTSGDLLWRLGVRYLLDASMDLRVPKKEGGVKLIQWAKLSRFYKSLLFGHTGEAMQLEEAVAFQLKGHHAAASKTTPPYDMTVSLISQPYTRKEIVGMLKSSVIGACQTWGFNSTTTTPILGPQDRPTSVPDFVTYMKSLTPYVQAVGYSKEGKLSIKIAPDLRLTISSSLGRKLGLDTRTLTGFLSILVHPSTFHEQRGPVNPILISSSLCEPNFLNRGQAPILATITDGRLMSKFVKVRERNLHEITFYFTDLIMEPVELHNTARALFIRLDFMVK